MWFDKPLLCGFLPTPGFASLETYIFSIYLKLPMGGVIMAKREDLTAVSYRIRLELSFPLAPVTYSLKVNNCSSTFLVLAALSEAIFR